MSCSTRSSSRTRRTRTRTFDLIINPIVIMMVLLLLLLGLTVTYQQCTHPVFCSEPILKAIAKANLFEDSKTFVDLVLKVPVNTALSNFLAYNTC